MECPSSSAGVLRRVLESLPRVGRQLSQAQGRARQFGTGHVLRPRPQRDGGYRRAQRRFRTRAARPTSGALTNWGRMGHVAIRHELPNHPVPEEAERLACAPRVNGDCSVLDTRFGQRRARPRRPLETLVRLSFRTVSTDAMRGLRPRLEQVAAAARPATRGPSCVERWAW